MLPGPRPSQRSADRQERRRARVVASSMRWKAITSSSASSSVRCGRQPVSSCSELVSGLRRPSSSKPSSYASSYGTKRIDELDAARAITRSASCEDRDRGRVADVEGAAARVLVRATAPRIAETASCTCRKQRDWLPSPYTVTSSPRTAWRANRGTTMP